MLGETPEALSFLGNRERKQKVIRKEPSVLGDRVIERKAHHCLRELEIPPRNADCVGKNGSGGADIVTRTILDKGYTWT